MTIENTIVEKVRVLSLEKQHQVLAFINLLEMMNVNFYIKVNFKNYSRKLI